MLIRHFASLALDLVELAMLIRALMSWIMPGESNRFTDIIYAVTEPFIAPMRKLLDRFDFVRCCPIDLPFLAACIFLGLLSSII